MKGSRPRRPSLALSNGDALRSTFNLNTASVITTFEDQLPLNDLYTQTMTITNQWDPSVSTDLTLAFT